MKKKKKKKKTTLGQDLKEMAVETLNDLTEVAQPIRIFIGVDVERSIAAEVLKYSVLKNTKSEVHFFHLDHKTIAEKTNNMKMPKMYTGFSFYRWAIPLMCDFKGKAIYMDSDIFSLSDIKELWDTPMGDCTHLCFKTYTSVMLINCSKTEWDFPSMIKQASKDKMKYKGFMWCKGGTCTSKHKGGLSGLWNHLDRHTKKWNPEAKLLHYTNVPTQPWTCLDHPYGYIFYDLMKEALEYGFITEEQVNNAIETKACHKDIWSKLK